MSLLNPVVLNITNGDNTILWQWKCIKGATFSRTVKFVSKPEQRGGLSVCLLDKLTRSRYRWRFTEECKIWLEINYSDYRKGFWGFLILSTDIDIDAQQLQWSKKFSKGCCCWTHSGVNILVHLHLRWFTWDRAGINSHRVTRMIIGRQGIKHLLCVARWEWDQRYSHTWYLSFFLHAHI